MTSPAREEQMPRCARHDTQMLRKLLVKTPAGFRSRLSFRAQRGICFAGPLLRQVHPCRIGGLDQGHLLLAAPAFDPLLVSNGSANVARVFTIDEAGDGIPNCEFPTLPRATFLDASGQIVRDADV